MIASITTIIVKQWSLKSSAVYYFLSLEVLIAIWIIKDILQIIFSNPSDNILPLIFDKRKIPIARIITNGIVIIRINNQSDRPTPIKSTLIVTLVVSVIADASLYTKTKSQ